MPQARIIISGGGTGGHIYPAIAIANAVLAQAPDADILFVGAEGKMEMEKVPQAGHRILGLPIVGINRSQWWKNWNFPFKWCKSLIKARQILKSFKPQVVVGVGGFASGPVLWTAARMGIPYLIQEQNSYAGLTNKWLGKGAQGIFVAYPDMEAFFPKDKLHFLGNPVRSDIAELEQKKSAALAHFGLNELKPVVLVIGGSLGARSINRFMEAHVTDFKRAELQVIWQTGQSDASRAAQAAEGLDGVYTSAFIYEMDLAYAAADVVISRAGALSVSEICLAKKPSILIPYPFAAEDHQTKNAQRLVHEGAALMVADAKVSEELMPKVLGLMQDKNQCDSMAKAAATLARPHAAKDLAQHILSML